MSRGPTGQGQAQRRAGLHHQLRALRLGIQAERIPWHRPHCRRHASPTRRACSRPRRRLRRAAPLERCRLRKVQMGCKVPTEVGAGCSKAASARSSPTGGRQEQGALAMKTGCSFQHTFHAKGFGGGSPALFLCFRDPAVSRPPAMRESFVA